MNFSKEKKEIIYWAGLLNQKGFVTAKNGNLSCKVNRDKILVTSHDSYLGHLEEKEVLLADLKGNVLEGELELTNEKSLHLDIQRKFKDAGVVIHAHPTFTTAFFHYFENLDIFSFEAKFYIGQAAVIPQETPIVVDTKPVLDALENTNIVILKGHGVVSIGRDFKEAFSLIELLEEQCRVNLVIKKIRIEAEASVLKKEESCGYAGKKFRLLSREHGQKLADLVNNDKEAQELGAKYNLTCSLAIKNQDTQEVMCFHYDKGRVVKVDDNDDAEFLIAGEASILKKVFNREIEPFVASAQGKVKTKGDFAKMSKWYPVLVRTFKLWEQAPVE
ncbi:MAG: class II aldolase/adducin family protein [Candidatus Omnitrophica bacterium]|nr:class II aldolase/adducin family protein [Candidatus Omnitrophota bacterium]